MSDVCPDCNGTKVYRGLNHEEPCRTCTPAAISDETREIGTALRALAEHQYGLPPGSLALYPSATPEQVSKLEEIIYANPVQSFREDHSDGSFTQVDTFDRKTAGGVVREHKVTRGGPKLEPVAMDSDGQVKPIDEIMPVVCERPDVWPAAPLERIIRGGSRAGKSAPEPAVHWCPECHMVWTAGMLLSVAGDACPNCYATSFRMGIDLASGRDQAVKAVVRIDPSGGLTVEEVLPEEAADPLARLTDWEFLKELSRRIDGRHPEEAAVVARTCPIHNLGWVSDGQCPECQKAAEMAAHVALTRVPMFIKMPNKVLSRPAPEDWEEWRQCVALFGISYKSVLMWPERVAAIFADEAPEAVAAGFLRILAEDRPELHDAEIVSIGYSIERGGLLAQVHHPSLKHDCEPGAILPFEWASIKT